jgi:hypothetical protein
MNIGTIVIDVANATYVGARAHMGEPVAPKLPTVTGRH